MFDTDGALLGIFILGGFVSALLTSFVFVMIFKFGVMGIFYICTAILLVVIIGAILVIRARRME